MEEQGGQPGRMQRRSNAAELSLRAASPTPRREARIVARLGTAHCPTSDARSLHGAGCP